MKTIFALLDENGKVLKTSNFASDIIDYANQLKNRREGNSARAIFKALGSDCPVYILYPNRSIAKLAFRLASTYLDNLEFKYEEYATKLIIKPKLSGSIYFTTTEDFRTMKLDPGVEYITIEDF